MLLTVKRFSDNNNATLGLLYIDDIFSGFTLEDEKRFQKVKGETRIPEGIYNIVYRTEGGHHIKYKSKYGKNHFGMLHIIDVPNFQYILIHIGNTEKDTDGCLLVGDTANFNHTIASSTIAYLRIYKIISQELNAGGKVKIEFLDIEK